MTTENIQNQEVLSEVLLEKTAAGLHEVLQRLPLNEPTFEPQVVCDVYNEGSADERQAYYRFGMRAFRTKKFCDCKGMCECPDPVPPPDSFEHDLTILFGEKYVKKTKLLNNTYADLHRFIIQQFFPVGMSQYELDVLDALSKRCGTYIPNGMLALVYKAIISEYELAVSNDPWRDEPACNAGQWCKRQQRVYYKFMERAFSIIIQDILKRESCDED